MPETVLILRTCNPDMTSHKGFLWPESGPVECPDWDPTPACGSGLHGFLWGEGDAAFANWAGDAKWLVVAVAAASVVDLGGKVKFPRGEVVFCGDRAAATRYLYDHGGQRYRILGLAYAGNDGETVTGGDHATVTGGDLATVTGGDFATVVGGFRATVTGDYRATVTGGNYAGVTGGNYARVTGGHGATVAGGHGATVTGGSRATVTGGNYARVTGGDLATVTGGHRATVTGGDYATVTGGNHARVTGGHLATVTGGHGATLVLYFRDGTRDRLAVAYVGEDGIKPDVPYRLDGTGAFTRVEAT